MKIVGYVRVSAKDQKTKKHVLNSLSGSAHRKTKQNGQL